MHLYNKGLHKNAAVRIEEISAVDCDCMGYDICNIIMSVRETSEICNKTRNTLLHLDWRSRREVLLPLTETIFHGHETTQLLNNCWSYDDEI